MKSVTKRKLICLSRLQQRYNDIFVKVMLDSATMLQSYAALVLHYGLYKRREQKNDRCALWKSQSYEKMELGGKQWLNPSAFFSMYFRF